MKTLNIGGRECVLGLDWSTWQTPRNLRPAKEQGFEVAVVKATEGDAYRDPRFRAHVDNATDAELTVGAYHFARPDWSDGTPAADGAQEARHVLSAIDSRVQFVVLDLEATILTARQTTEYAVGFWQEIVAFGRFPIRAQRMTYVGRWFGFEHTQALPELSCLWIPSYTDPRQLPNPNPEHLELPAWHSDLWPEGWCGWQYTDKGTAGGLHPSDCNVFTTDWLRSVRTGTQHDTQHFARQEDEMPRPTYAFPPGFDHPDAGTLLIDLRNGAYPTPEGVKYGPHWYLSNAADEIAVLVLNREIDPANPKLFAAGNDQLDALWERWPHIPAGTQYAAATAPVGVVDEDALAERIAAQFRVTRVAT